MTVSRAMPSSVTTVAFVERFATLQRTLCDIGRTRPAAGLLRETRGVSLKDAVGAAEYMFPVRLEQESGQYEGMHRGCTVDAEAAATQPNDEDKTVSQVDGLVQDCYTSDGSVAAVEAVRGQFEGVDREEYAERSRQRDRMVSCRKSIQASHACRKKRGTLTNNRSSSLLNIKHSSCSTQAIRIQQPTLRN